MKIAVALAITFAAAACTVLAEPPAAAAAAAAAGRAAGQKTFDNADWAEVLRSHVDDRGRVDYRALAANRTALDRFVATLAQTGPSTHPDLFPTRAERLAYYLNAYNALTMFNVINRWPKIESVHDERLGFFVLTQFKLDGDEINLYDLENKVIRPTFKEPRVHFALNCASIGCPVLPAEPFAAERLETQLARETSRFLHEKRNVEVVAGTGAVRLSSIFDWYKEDFGGDPIAWIRGVAPDLALPATNQYEVRDYDWRLNDQARQETP